MAVRIWILMLEVLFILSGNNSNPTRKVLGIERLRATTGQKR